MLQNTNGHGASMETHVSRFSWSQRGSIVPFQSSRQLNPQTIKQLISQAWPSLGDLISLGSLAGSTSWLAVSAGLPGWLDWLGWLAGLTSWTGCAGWLAWLVGLEGSPRILGQLDPGVLPALGMPTFPHLLSNEIFLITKTSNSNERCCSLSYFRWEVSHIGPKTMVCMFLFELSPTSKGQTVTRKGCVTPRYLLAAILKP